ncbi:hypothetical protein EBZ39_05615 [bacterium]|nr:hypothetical protein [bacterium]
MAQHRTGFTLLELLMIGAIVLVAATIAIPLLLQPADHDLVASLQELETLCLCAQYSAMASNQPCLINIDAANNSCCLRVDQQTWAVKLPASCTFGFLPGLLGPPGDPRTTVTQAVTFQAETKQPAIIFQQNGIISCGTLYVIDRHKSLQGALTCGVSQVSYIRRYLYKNGQWHVVKA